MGWMDPSLSLSSEAAYRAAQLQLQRLKRDELLARADQFMLTALVNQRLLSQAMKRVAELELQAALNLEGQLEAVQCPPAPPLPRPPRPTPWGRFGLC